MRAGTLSNLRVALETAPGTALQTSREWIFTIVKNQANVAGATATCTIEADARTCTITGPVSFANGERFTLHADASSGGNAPANTRIAYTAEYSFTP